MRDLTRPQPGGTDEMRAGERAGGKGGREVGEEVVGRARPDQGRVDPHDGALHGHGPRCPHGHADRPRGDGRPGLHCWGHAPASARAARTDASSGLGVSTQMGFV